MPLRTRLVDGAVQGVVQTTRDPIGLLLPRLKWKQPRAVDLNVVLDRSLKQGGFWEKGSFEVDCKATHDEVQQHLSPLKVKEFADGLEGLGYTVHAITTPCVDPRPLPTAPDRRRYLMFAWVSRRPVQPIFDIPDRLVPAFQEKGLRLLE